MPYAFIPEGPCWEKKSRVAGRLDREAGREDMGPGRSSQEQWEAAQGFRGWGPAQPLGVSRDSWFPKAPLEVGKDGHRSEQLTVLKMNKFLIYHSD